MRARFTIFDSQFRSVYVLIFGSRYMHGRNTDSRRKVNKQTVIFRVFCEVDEEETEHSLSLNNYRQDRNGDAPYHHWVLLS